MADSLYLHVPFCKSICFYCDFKRTLYNEEIAYRWLDALKKEIEDKNINKALKTIYIGGGTPTSLTYDQLNVLLELLKTYSNEVIEYTIESNIESLSIDKIKLLIQYGVNRISLGVQSLQDDLLIYMNRKHSRKDVFNKINEIYECGIHNISVDLIYGFQNQSIDMWIEDLRCVASNEKISHISIYSLTIEENSVFGKRNIKPIDEQIEGFMYEKAIEVLKEYGYKQYEVANFAKDDKESMHNKTYWNYDDFYGIGVGASGKENLVRYDITGSINEYINGKHKIINENLSIKESMFENIMMSLRMKKGLNLNTFKQRYKVDFYDYYKEVIDKEIDNGNLILKNNYLYTSEKGMFVLHDILINFMEE